MNIIPIILAAGKGTRMNSSLPKVMHLVGGKSMLQHVIDSCRELNPTNIVTVYGHGATLVKESVEADDIKWALQSEQKGTGHAVSQAEEFIDDDAIIIIATGDVPLIKGDTLKKLIEKSAYSALTVLTTIIDNPFGYGRIVRNDNGKIQRIVEEKDATNEQQKIQEINTGFIAAKGLDLKRWLDKIKPNNAQGEYYLTDCIALAVEEGGVVEAVICDNPVEVQGVNNRMQQAELERAYQDEQAQKLMTSGVTLLDPKRVDIRGSLETGQDVSIDVNTIFIGKVVLGDSVTIESGCVITDSEISSNVIIKANSVLEQAKIGESCDVGPFARVRPGAVLEKNSKIGNFVEIKKSIVGEGSKVSHLSYIGDTKMGKNVNIGAGTITCNYDGVNKFQTTIGDNVFIGSDSQLVAPVTIADDATIGAGSTITKDSPANELTLSRSKQITIKGWKKPTKAKRGE